MIYLDVESSLQIQRSVRKTRNWISQHAIFRNRRIRFFNDTSRWYIDRLVFPSTIWLHNCRVFLVRHLGPPPFLRTNDDRPIAISLKTHINKSARIYLRICINMSISTKYFLLNRSASSRTDNNTDNHIIHVNPGKRQVFLLPEVNLDYYWRKGLFECHLIEWAKQFCKPDKLFLDIGAHTGTYSISLAAHCREVFAFEPQKSTFYALCGGVAMSCLANRITCHNCGLGSDDQVGEQKLKIVSADGGGSSLLPDKNHAVLREETIAVKRLDDFGFSNVGFIKMDVENNELNVLKGALETLLNSDYPPILFESNGENPALFGFLREALKYKIVKVGGVSNMYLACKE